VPQEHQRQQSQGLRSSGSHVLRRPDPDPASAEILQKGVLTRVMAPEETTRVIIRCLGYPWRTLHVGHVAFMTSVLWCRSDVRNGRIIGVKDRHAPAAPLGEAWEPAEAEDAQVDDEGSASGLDGEQNGDALVDASGGRAVSAAALGSSTRQHCRAAAATAARPLSELVREGTLPVATRLRVKHLRRLGKRNAHPRSASSSRRATRVCTH